MADVLMFLVGTLATYAAILTWKYRGRAAEAPPTPEALSERGASDAAIAQLAARVSKLEKQVMAQDLQILDTAERVAHKLQDRKRKRDEMREDVPAEDHDEVPSDPNLLLAYARKQYNQPTDPRQLELIDGEAR